MAINFNDQNQGIGSLDLGQFGMQQPEENMQVAEAFNFGLLPQATENFKPDFGGMFDSTQNLGNNYKGTSKADFINAIQSGAFGVGGREMFDRNVGDVFEGVNLDKKGYNPFSNVSPTLTGTEDGTFRGAIDIDKGSLSPEAIKNLPADFFKSIGDQSSLGLPTNDRYASLSSYFTPTTMNDASNNTMINADSVLKTPSRLFGGVTQPSKRFRDHSNMKSYLQANPDMGQNIKNKIGAGFNNVKDFAMNKGTEGFNLGKMALSGIGNAIMPGLGFVLSNLKPEPLFRETLANSRKANPLGTRGVGPNGVQLDGVSDFGGFTTDDLGRITNNGLNYNTPEGIMSGYNSGFDLAGSALDRIGTIKNALKKGRFKNVNKANQRINNLKTAAVASAQAKRQAYQDKIDRARNEAAAQRARVKSISAGYGGNDDRPGATGPTATGAGMGVGGGYNTDYGFLKDGGSVGLASMFTRRR